MATAKSQPATQLTKTDFDHLQRGYIARNVVIAAGIHRVDSYKGAQLVGQLTKKNAPKKNCAGIVFPYRYPEDDSVREVRLRRDNPEQDTKGKELNKYLAPPGATNKFYFAPSAKKAWLKALSIPVIFVEGEKKCLALQRFFDERSEPVLVIGLSGIWNWRGKVGKTINGNGACVAVKGAISDFALVEWMTRQVEIIFDAPPYQNNDVKAAQKALATHLRALGATVRSLVMPDAKQTGCKGIDDLLGAKGVGFVSDWLTAARANAKPDRTSVKAAGYSFTAEAKGVTAQGHDEHGNAIGSPIIISSEIHVEAVTRDGQAGNYGRLLRFVDPDGNEKLWAMPASLRAGDKAAYESYLLDQGADIFNSKLLHIYFGSKPAKRVLVVNRTGWHKSAFVLADECIGNDGDEIFHQSPEGGNFLLRTAGTLDEWQKYVSRLCVGNSRLIFAVSAGFAAPLLAPLGKEGGGFHFRDENSKGKTTLLIVAGSTSGGGAKNGFIRRWRATINGLEATAVSHNDILLCLDELAEVDAREVGETAYMLANGQAKLRMQKNIALGRSAEWLTLFLSTGEISLATHMATAGKQMRGGMDVRLLDLPADAGAGLGLFEELHGATSARDFADNLKEAARNYYGTPLREFLRRLAQKAKDDLRTTWQAFQKDFLQTCQTRFLQQQLMQPQIGRACDRFALVAFAGEMAAEVGITEWKEGDARIAALRMFGDWLSARGLGSTEEEAAIRQVRLFLEAHGDARFRRLGGEDTRSIENQAGLVEIESDGAVYYLKPEIFRGVVCKGYDVKQVVKTLKARQWLICNHGFQYKQHDPDNGRTLPFYAISSAILDAE